MESGQQDKARYILCNSDTYRNYNRYHNSIKGTPNKVVYFTWKYSKLAMKSIAVLLFLSLAVLGARTERSSPSFFSLLTDKTTKDRNGGGDCAACTGIFIILGQIAQYNNVPNSEALPTFCSYMNGIFRTACDGLVESYGPNITALLDSGDNGDVICHSLGYCYSDPGQPYCHVLPEPSGGLSKAIESAIERNSRPTHGTKLRLCDLPPLVELCDYIADSSESRYPIFDNDKDGFSTVETLRGYDWRGFDCDDENSEIYPGRVPINEDRDFDSNCNGIWGVNPTSGIAYETELCGDSEPRGILFYGDSAGAHFHLPEEWLEVDKYSSTIFNNITFVVENEADWPHMSMGTGFTNVTWEIVLQNASTNSLYWRLRNRNLCNHNDYHNQAYNGGKSDNILELNFTRSRNHDLDKPVLAVYAEVGNDVCNGREDTFGFMTTPENYTKNVLSFFDAMNKTLPKGSHLLTVGLLMGEYLYPSLVDHYHPLGKLNSDITYGALYEWLDCLLSSPCRGWMFPDEADRNITTERANVLSAILEQLSIENADKYDNFDIKYLRFPVDVLAADYGDQFYLLLEPVDGFHPNRASQQLFAAYMWTYISNHFGDFIGPENPNNALIHSLFGI